METKYWLITKQLKIIKNLKMCCLIRRAKTTEISTMQTKLVCNGKKSSQVMKSPVYRLQEGNVSVWF